MSKANRPKTGIYYTSAWTATLSRWIDLMLVVMVAFSLCLLLRPLISIVSDHLASAITEFPLPIQLSIIGILSAAVWLPVIRLGGFRIKDIVNGSLLYYPPTWFGGLIGAIAYIIFVHGLGAENEPTSAAYTWAITMLAGILIFPVGVSFALICNGFAHDKRHKRHKEIGTNPAESKNQMNDSQMLRAWIYSEAPIERPSDALFDYEIIAERISKLIASDAEKNIGLVGPYGSGKSSLLNLVEYNLNGGNGKRLPRSWFLRHSWHFCRLDAWGRDPEHFAEQLLRTMVESLGRSVDVLSIISMPKHYTEAMSASDSAWLSIPSALLNATTDPVTCLCKLDRILRATRSRMLIFVEDLDRNASDDFLNSQLPALLDRIRHLQNVHFVFAIGSEKESAQIMMRITQHLESLDTVTRTHAKDIVTVFRNYCMGKYPEDIDPVESDKRDSRFRLISKTIVYPDGIEDYLSGEYPGTHDYVADALSNPRVLKQVLRRVDRAWDSLHGEIDFDDLFLVHLLRYLYKEVFAFLLNNINTFRSLNNRENDDDGVKRKRDELTEALNTVIKPSEMEIVDNLIQSLFPTWKKDRWATNHQSPQGVRHSVPTDYWSRLQQELIAPAEMRDQAILQAIKHWQQYKALGGDNNSFANIIIASRGTSAKVSHFSLLLSEEDTHQLASEVHSIILKQHGNNAYCDSNHVFRDLWYSSLDRIWTGHEQWLVDEMAKALPISLRFANDLYYFWRNQSKNDVSFNPNTTGIRQKCIKAARQLWDDDVHRMTSALSPNHPESLFIFVIEFSKSDMVGDGFKYAEWKWCFDMMVNALKASPAIMAPQFIQFH